MESPGADNSRVAAGRAEALDAGISDFWRRVGAGAVALLLLAPLVMAAMLRAEPAGHGTHRQFGWPSCGMLVATGHPCPTCGMTTAWTHAAHGNWAMAVATQPGGVVLCVLASVGFWVALHTALFGSRAFELALGLLRPRPLMVLGGVLLASWVYKLLTWSVEGAAVGGLFGR